MEDLLLKAKESLKRHEGFSEFPYVDTVGKMTIGYGYNLTDRGLSKDWAEKQLEYDVIAVINVLHENFKDWFELLNDDRKCVLVDMCFNMGFNKFLTFKKMIEEIKLAITSGDYSKVSKEMIDSKWAWQVGERALRLSSAMKTGVYLIK